MQAIITKYLSPTNTKGARIKAIAGRGSLIVELGPNETWDHVRACRLLREKFAREDLKEYGTPVEKNPWLRPMVCGTLPTNEYAHVFINS